MSSLVLIHAQINLACNVKKMKSDQYFFSPYFVEFHPQLSFWKKKKLQPDLDPNYLPQGIKQVR